MTPVYVRGAIILASEMGHRVHKNPDDTDRAVICKLEGK